MCKHPIAIAAGLCAAVIVIPLAGFFGVAWYIECQRVRDADPAFLPLVPLGVSVLSNPVAFHRYCIYIAEFPPESKLCDENASELISLNALPEKNELDLIISTPRVTDSSLQHLRAVRKIDFLDVTKSSISDKGIAELRATFPDARVVEHQRDTKTEQVLQR